MAKKNNAINWHPVTLEKLSDLGNQLYGYLVAKGCYKKGIRDNRYDLANEFMSIEGYPTHDRLLYLTVYDPNTETRKVVLGHLDIFLMSHKKPYISFDCDLNDVRNVVAWADVFENLPIPYSTS